LYPFFESSEKELADLKAAVLAFKTKFEGLVAQYGEEPATTDTEGFYSTFYNFAGSFNVRQCEFTRPITGAWFVLLDALLPWLYQ
jgi:hypothetical protein